MRIQGESAPHGPNPGTLEERFREAKLPLTIQRRAVYKEVLEHPSHPTAEEVHALVCRTHPEFPKTTVYRALETLVRVGLLQRVAHPGSAVRYDANIHRHHHLTCLECGRIVDVVYAPLDTLPIPGKSVHGFTIVDHSVHFQGWCSSCRPEGSENRKPRGH
jgi:Fe2+ or Zn2+ uptake regulation protein